jgi:hypothetical protein
VNLPITLSEIAPEWLSLALSDQYPGIQVSGVTIEDADSGTTGRGRISLEYSAALSGPSRVFVKLPPDDEGQRAFVTENGMGRREVLFYSTLSAELPLRVPHSYYADSNEVGDRYIMLLEDLDASACSFRNGSTRYSLEYIREVLAAFARMHGMYWNSKRFSSDLAWVPPPGFHPMAPLLVERALEQYADSMPPVFRAMGDFYLQNTASIHRLWGEGVPTLVHGDVHDANLFYDKGPGFLDWALVGRTSCMRDVAYFMSGSLKPADRVAHQSELLDFYYAELDRHTEDQVDTAELGEQYRWHAAYVWLGATVTLAMGSEWQPVDYVLGTLERVNPAIEDCDSIASLRNQL